MVQVTNKSPGQRSLLIKEGDGAKSVTLNPGETKDIELFDPKSKIVRGLVGVGDIVIGKPPVDDDEDEGDNPQLVEQRLKFDAAFAVVKNRADGLQSLADARLREIDDLKAKIAELEAKLAAGAGQGAAPPDDLKAVHKGGGSFSILKGDEEVAKGLSKADADAFNELSAPDKAAYVTAKA
jgi:hypothetical protein